MSAPSHARPTVALAGATGFVGTAVREALADAYNLIVLTRSPVRAEVQAPSNESAIEWRHCDLFSPQAIAEALSGADYAIYLVHSLLPSARLSQGTAADFDLLLADNFARAAETKDLAQIVYVGGLIPEDAPRTGSLARRIEIEETLGSCQTPLTALRAGLIVGPGGTRLRMVINLVRRLPVMVLPGWAQATTQPVALSDVTRALRHVLGRPETYGEQYDIGGPDVMSYRTMLERTADVLDKQRYLIDTPVDLAPISKLWVRLFGGVPQALVNPIVESLRHDAVVRDNPLQNWLQPDALSFDEALRQSVDERGRPLANPRSDLRDEEDRYIRERSVVRSVQRLPLPTDFDAYDVAREYMEWLPRFGWPALDCHVEGDVVHFDLRPFGLTMLQLVYDRDQSEDWRQLFYVTGGWLSDSAHPSQGRLEFRTALDGQCALAAVHDFAPTLPWYVYNATQAIAHLGVMHGFGRYLGTITADRQPSEAAP